MSWTHRNAPDMFQLYPEMAEMNIVLRAWPGMVKVAFEAGKLKGKPEDYDETLEKK